MTDRLSAGGSGDFASRPTSQQVSPDKGTNLPRTPAASTSRSLDDAGFARLCWLVRIAPLSTRFVSLGSRARLRFPSHPPHGDAVGSGLWFPSSDPRGLAPPSWCPCRAYNSRNGSASLRSRFARLRCEFALADFRDDVTGHIRSRGRVIGAQVGGRGANGTRTRSYLLCVFLRWCFLALGAFFTLTETAFERLPQSIWMLWTPEMPLGTQKETLVAL
jgi:hypothetical protein